MLDGRFVRVARVRRILIVASRNGYETTASGFIVDGSDLRGLTLAINRTQGGNSGARVLGVTTVRAQSLQKAATISHTVPRNRCSSKDISAPPTPPAASCP